ncbi:MAG: hypothetical protein HY657_19455 [Acidobacteria bacterium]|nr:hypothetical protein [Acidobacteriota bacterium]
MIPWLHLLFIPAVLFLGVQIGIQIGLRRAASGGPASEQRRAMPASEADVGMVSS